MPSRCWSRLQSPYSSRASTQLTPRSLSVLFVFGLRNAASLAASVPWRKKSQPSSPDVSLVGFASVLVSSYLISLAMRVELSSPGPACCLRRGLISLAVRVELSSAGPSACPHLPVGSANRRQLRSTDVDGFRFRVPGSWEQRCRVSN